MQRVLLARQQTNELFRVKQKQLMYFQLEADYYSNEANKNKYKNAQLIASRENNLKIATGCTGHSTCNGNLSLLVAWTSKYFVA